MLRYSRSHCHGTTNSDRKSTSGYKNRIRRITAVVRVPRPLPPPFGNTPRRPHPQFQNPVSTTPRTLTSTRIRNLRPAPARESCKAASCMPHLRPITRRRTCTNYLQLQTMHFGFWPMEKPCRPQRVCHPGAPVPLVPPSSCH